jgi:hypothetical protein
VPYLRALLLSVFPRPLCSSVAIVEIAVVETRP